jgi:hypothetical protein
MSNPTGSALIARIKELEEALQRYAKEYCEGYCREDDRIFSDDCSGCLARKVLNK